MISKEIANRLVQLKEKAKTYSANYNSFLNFEKRDAVDELKKDVNHLNEQLTKLFGNIDTILLGGLNANFEMETWFEGLKDKSVFLETNPRLIYEEEQRELENQRKIAEEKAKQELEELEWQRMIEAEKAKKEHEEYKKRLQERRNNEQAKRVEEFRSICYYGPDDITKVQKLISEGLDISHSGHSIPYDLSTIIGRGRSVQFIKYLIAAGMKITAHDVLFCIKSKSNFNSEEFLNAIISAKNINQEAVGMAKAAIMRKKEQQSILLEQENKLAKLKEITQGKYDSFYKLLKEGDLEDIKKVVTLVDIDINQNIKMNNSEVTFTILSIFETRSIEFIQFLVDEGYLVTKKNLEYYYNNISKFPNFKQILNVLVNSKHIDSDAIEKTNEIKRELELKKQNYIKQYQIAEFRNLCHNGPEDTNKVQKIISEGFDIAEKDVLYPISTLINQGRSVQFITFLVNQGMKITKPDVECCIKSKPDFNSIVFLNLLISAKNIDKEAIEMAKEALRKKVEDKKTILEQNDKLKKLIQITYGKYDSFENFFTIGTLAEIKQAYKLELFDINHVFKNGIPELSYTLLTIFQARSIEFIKFLVDSGYSVKKSDIEYYKNESPYAHLTQSPSHKQILNILLTSKNIECEAIALIEEIKKEERILSDIMLPTKTSKEIDGVKTKIENTNKNKNHRIKRHNLIFWIIVSAILIALITLFIIYFKEIIDFIKVLVVFVIAISVLAWGIKNKR